MVTKKDVIVILLTFCLSAILFIALPTRSQTTREYDPWADVSGPTIGEPDGTINMRDIQYEILRFNTYGTPVNRTSLLEAQSQIENLTTLIFELQSRTNSLNATVIEQQNTINNLNQTVVYLNETVTILNSTGLGAPDYDSGWVASSGGTNHFLTHNLNTSASELVVYILGRYHDAMYGDLIHQWYYGGELTWDPILGERQRGIFWDAANNNTIRVCNLGSPNYYESVRVKIWKIPQP